MLADQRGTKPNNVSITEKILKDTKQSIQKGIIKKLVAAKGLLDIDKEAAAGLYIYAVEELGKLLLLEKIKKKNGRYNISYKKEFLNHSAKFSIALDYLQEHNYNKCIILNDEGGFSPNSFSWKGFTIGLLPKTKSRLSIFYTDFVYSHLKVNQIEIMKIPIVDGNILTDAINELETVINSLASVTAYEIDLLNLTRELFSSVNLTVKEKACTKVT